MSLFLTLMRTSVTANISGRCRLETDFIVFRGNEHESSGQLLKGVVVLCLSSPLRMEDIRLRLTGTLRLKYATPSPPLFGSSILA